MEGNTSTKLYQINRDHIISYDVSDRKMTKYDFIMEDEEIEDSNWVSVSEDVIVLCGGMKQECGCCTTNAAYSFHFPSGTATRLQDMKSTKFEHGIAFLRNHVFTFGGYQTVSVESNQAEKYDLTADKWVLIRDPPCRLNTTACTVYEEDIYIAGSRSREAILFYNPDEDDYQELSLTISFLFKAPKAIFTYGTKLWVLDNEKGSEEDLSLEESGCQAGGTGCEDPYYQIFMMGQTAVYDGKIYYILSNGNIKKFDPEMKFSVSAANLATVN